MDVKKQTEVFVIHINTARDPIVYGMYAWKDHRKLETFSKNYFIKFTFLSSYKHSKHRKTRNAALDYMNEDRQNKFDIQRTVHRHIFLQ